MTDLIFDMKELREDLGKSFLNASRITRWFPEIPKEMEKHKTYSHEKNMSKKIFFMYSRSRYMAG